MVENNQVLYDWHKSLIDSGERTCALLKRTVQTLHAMVWT